MRNFLIILITLILTFFGGMLTYLICCPFTPGELSMLYLPLTGLYLLWGHEIVKYINNNN
jgi:hypothetical protein